MKPDDAELTRLLEATRRADLPDAARLARVRGRLLPPSAATSHSPQPSPTGTIAAAAGRSLLGAKLAVGLAVVALAGAWVHRQTVSAVAVEPVSAIARVEPVEPVAAPPQAEQVAPALPIAAPPAVTVPALPNAQRKRIAPTWPQPRAAEPVAEPVAPVSTLSAEVTALRLATLAARAGRLAEARLALAQFERNYPSSQLKAERERLAHTLDQLELERSRARSISRQ